MWLLSSSHLAMLHYTAKKSAASTYFPIVAILNLLYLLLRVIYQRDYLTKFHGAMALLLVGLSIFSYKGVLEDHANSAGVAKDKALPGGASLDLLGLTVLVQYGSLASNHFYYLLVLIPLHGGYKLYTTFFGKGGGLAGTMPKNDVVESTSGGDGNADSDLVNSKKQKRAERRRQKWS